MDDKGLNELTIKQAENTPDYRKFRPGRAFSERELRGGLTISAKYSLRVRSLTRTCYCLDLQVSAIHTHT